MRYQSLASGLPEDTSVLDAVVEVSYLQYYAIVNESIGTYEGAYGIPQGVTRP